MSFILGCLPFVINLILIGSDILWIFTLPISLIIGCVNVSIYYGKKKNDYAPGTYEYEHYKNKQSEWTGAAISGTISTINSAKKGIKETMDPDKWTTKL